MKLPHGTRGRYLAKKERHEVKLHSDDRITTLHHPYGVSDRVSVILTTQELEDMQKLPQETQVTYIKGKINNIIG